MGYVQLMGVDSLFCTPYKIMAVQLTASLRLVKGPKREWL